MKFSVTQVSNLFFHFPVFKAKKKIIPLLFTLILLFQVILSCLVALAPAEHPEIALNKYLGYTGDRYPQTGQNSRYYTYHGRYCGGYYQLPCRRYYPLYLTGYYPLYYRSNYDDLFYYDNYDF